MTDKYEMDWGVEDGVEWVKVPVDWYNELVHDANAASWGALVIGIVLGLIIGGFLF